VVGMKQEGKTISRSREPTRISWRDRGLREGYQGRPKKTVRRGREGSTVRHRQRKRCAIVFSSEYVLIERKKVQKVKSGER